MEQLNVFEDTFFSLIKDGVNNVQLDSSTLEEEPPVKEEWTKRNPTNLTCSYCRVEFPDSLQQRDHYKLDWHRYNLKQSLLARDPLTEEQFNEKSDDLSSISGSDSEKEETLDTMATAQGKVFLRNKDGRVFSLYKCLVVDRKEEIADSVLLQRLTSLNSEVYWTIFMLGGGHFAGAVFKGCDPVLHKTFHCYTVRQGQGGSQSVRDSKSGSQPKSAGASLRRYNETALLQHVKDIVDLWKPEIDKSYLILYRAAGSYNKSVLFGGKIPILERADPRLRTIPFSTRRATFSEVKRVHSFLSTVYAYSSLDVAMAQFTKQKSPVQESKRNKAKTSCINRAKSREIIERPVPFEESPSGEESEENSDSDDAESQEGSVDAFEYSTSDVEVSFQKELEEFGDSLTPAQRSPKKRKAPKKTKNQKLRELEAQRKKDMYEIISKGKVSDLKDVLEGCKILTDTAETANEHLAVVEKEKRDGILSEVLDDSKNTLLHVAAIHEQVDMVSFLLENGADPCAKNGKQYTPYTCMQSKTIRDLFRDYAQKNPDKHNYNKAQIPINHLTPEEQAEKKKLQRKFKREKEKEKKKENDLKRQEDKDKDRFLKLSDREKRALAAERRILSQSGTVLTRCFLCGADMSGKVPFEYLGNRFCSMDCLKAHRMQHPVQLS